MAVDFHHITVANLTAAARIYLSVNCHHAVLHELFGLVAVLCEVREFQQLTKANGFVTDRNVIRVRGAHV